MRRLWIALALPALWVPSQGRAFDAARCDNGGDPVPPFAIGRDGSGCLLIDRGDGTGAVRFDFETHGSDNPAMPSSSGGGGTCGSSNDCAAVVWSTSFDDFLSTGSGSSGSDALHWSGKHYKWMLFKDGGIGNTWKCQGGSWTSPTGLQGCSAGEVSSGHVDALQMRGQPVNDGWAVFQDWTIANANDIHVILEMCGDQEYVGPPPGFVFQGVRVGYFPGWGAADDWTRDCIAMGDDACGVPAPGSARWQVGSNCSSEAFKATWLINSWSHVRVEADRTEKLIVVNGGTGGGCDNTNGCDGSIGFENGWPAPLGHATPSKGPGSCPNGLLTPGDIRTAGGLNPVPVYCYTSIEAALSDTRTSTSNLGDCPDCPHARPPFLQLSSSGWAAPPQGVDREPPAPPVILP
jgi:hypothetical protein